MDQRKYYKDGKGAEENASIAKANDEVDFQKREEIYSRNREALQKQFR